MRAMQNIQRGGVKDALRRNIRKALNESEFRVELTLELPLPTKFGSLHFNQMDSINFAYGQCAGDENIACNTTMIVVSYANDSSRKAGVPLIAIFKNVPSTFLGMP